MPAKKRVIDKRRNQKFIIDDYFVDHQAQLVGSYATSVYMVLCRHAGKEQECFPSIKLIAEKLRISRDSVMRGLQELEKYSVIGVQKTRAKNGIWRNNSYVLFDKSEWLKEAHQVADSDMVKDEAKSPTTTRQEGQPSRSQQPDQVAHSDTKETHVKETHTVSNETEAKPQFGREDINQILDDFEKIRGFRSAGGKRDRMFAKHLLDNFTRDQIRAMLVYCKSEQFAPRVGSLERLWFKRGEIIDGILKKQQENQSKVLVLS